MIVYAKCSDQLERKFLVHFSHFKKKCTCEIWLCSSVSCMELQKQYPNVIKSISSPKHPDTNSKILMVSAVAECSKHDNYVRAYGRALSLKRALRVMIDKFYDSTSITSDVFDTENELGWKFDNQTFLKFMHELRVQCPHGYEMANKLQKIPGYNLNEEWKS